MPRYTGDTGRFRQALELAGFGYQAEGSIFNDDSKAKPKQPTRRLKLWFADEVFNASQKAQRKLEKCLRKQFGDRIISMYFVQGSHAYGRVFGLKSLCIKLRDI